MREWLARLRDWFRRDALDAELQEELRFHEAQLEREAGPDDARRRLGNVTRVREESRDRWSIPWLDILQQDVRYALRGLRRSPAFTATVVLTLGLGVGANAAMFGVMDRLMFRPFPWLRDPASVHRVYLQETDRGRVIHSTSTEYTRFLDLKKWTTSFSEIAAISDGTMAVGTGEASRERPVARVSASFFDFFSARPAAGRFFVAAEDTTPRGAEVVVLGYDFWKAEFGGRDVLGQVLQVGTIPAVIIGVAPEGFVGVAEGPAPAVFIPITTYAGYATFQDDPTNYYTAYNWGWLGVMVRRKPGVSVARASQDLSHAYLRSWNAEVALVGGGTPASVAHPRAFAGAMRRAAGPDAGLEAKTLYWVTGVAVIVLLIACANVANLMFARVLRRRRETAVRLALGVSRTRLVLQALTESVILAGLGCLAGVAIAQWGGAALRHLFVQEGSLEVLGDRRTLGVALAVALVAGLVTGLGPAFFATRADLSANLKSGTREGGQSHSRTRSVLLILQAALSVVLLVGAGLFERSLGHVRAMRLGYDADPVLLISPSLRGTVLDSAQRVALRRQLIETGLAIPGAEHAAVASSIPFWSTSSTNFYVAGVDSVRRLGRFTYQTSTPDYFATMDTRILRGRPFTAEDRRGTPPVVVISEAMGRTLWPGQDPIGQCMRIGDPAAACTTVIGIAEDALQNSLTDDKRLRYYLPADQFHEVPGSYMLLRLSGRDAASAVEEVRAALQRVMPGQSYVTVQPFGDVVDGQRRPWQVGATMFIAFGLLALLVAAVGLYGVITYGVTQRMHELGVRIALGAQARDVIRLVVGQGMSFAITGVLIGLAVSQYAAPWIQPLLFQQSARDPVVYGFVGLLLMLVALVASTAPARRATKADPNTALRSD